MSRQARDKGADETFNAYDQFRTLSASGIVAAQHDLLRDPARAGTIIGRLTRSNPNLALALLAGAREAADEVAYLQGALTVLGAQVKQAESRVLAKLLCTPPLLNQHS